MLRPRTLLGLAALSCCAGCLNLDLADPAKDNHPPRAQFVDLVDQQLLPLRPQLRASAEDRDGIARLSLSCHSDQGDGELAAVTDTTMDRQVELTPCVRQRIGEPGPIPPVPVTLTLSAQDRLGASADTKLTVLVDPLVPTQTTQVPERTAPGAQLDLEIAASTTLAHAPDVTLDGAPVEATDLGSNHYKIHLSMPEVGVDTQPPGAPRTAELLEALEKTVTLQIGVSTPNGNSDVQRYPILVSRILWERPVPGKVALTSAPGQSTVLLAPEAGPSGLSVPLEIEANSAYWEPALLATSDGAFSPPPVRYDLDGLFGATFDTLGDPILRYDALTSPFRFFDLHGPAVDGVLPDGPYMRLPDRVCAVADYDCTAAAPQMAVQCLGRDGSAPSQTFNLFPYQGGMPRFTVSSGDAVLGVGLATTTCGADNNRALWITKTGVKLIGFAVEAPIQFVMPTGKDGFIFFASKVTDDVGNVLRAAGPYFIDGTLDSSGYFKEQPYDLTGLSGQPQPVTGLPDGSMLCIDPSTSPASEWVLHVDRPPDHFTLPLWLASDAFASTLGNLSRGKTSSPTSVVYPDGRVAVLVRTHDYGRAVLGLDADQKPHWLYRFPHASDFSVLVGGPGTHLYFVDLSNPYAADAVALTESW